VYTPTFLYPSSFFFVSCFSLAEYVKTRIGVSSFACTTNFAVAVLPDPGRAETMTLFSFSDSTIAFCSGEGLKVFEELNRIPVNVLGRIFKLILGARRYRIGLILPHSMKVSIRPCHKRPSNCSPGWLFKHLKFSMYCSPNRMTNVQLEGLKKVE